MCLKIHHCNSQTHSFDSSIVLPDQFFSKPILFTDYNFYNCYCILTVIFIPLLFLQLLLLPELLPGLQLLPEPLLSELLFLPLRSLPVQESLLFLCKVHRLQQKEVSYLLRQVQAALLRQSADYAGRFCEFQFADCKLFQQPAGSTRRFREFQYADCGLIRQTADSTGHIK